VDLRTVKVRSQQKRCTFLARVDPTQSQRTDASGCDRCENVPLSPEVEIFKLWRRIRLTPSCESQSALRRSTVGESNCCSNGAGSGSNADVVGESHRAVCDGARGYISVVRVQQVAKTSFLKCSMFKIR